MIEHIDLNRRTFLAMVSLATAIEAVPARAARSDEDRAPDALAAWLRCTGGRRIVATLAEARAGSGWRTLGTFKVSAHSRRSSAGDASLTQFALRQNTTEIVRDLLRVAAARAWQIPPEACEIRPGHMANKMTGQRLPYRLVLTV